MDIAIEDLLKKVRLVKLGIAGVTAIDDELAGDLLPLEELVREIEQGLVALGKQNRQKARKPGRVVVLDGRKEGGQ